MRSEYEFNRHIRDCAISDGRQGHWTLPDFTLEWNVKNPDWSGISEEDLGYEIETGVFCLSYGEDFFRKAKRLVKSERWSIEGWMAAGRSGGWLCFSCLGDPEHITDRQREKLEDLFQEYWDGFNKCLRAFYKERDTQCT